MLNNEVINWIEGTPLGISIREIDRISPHIHENIIEITVCLKGEIKLSYCFEEFTLKEGDFLVLDKDVHFLYEGKNAICASLYIDIKKMMEQFPYVQKRFYVCEYTNDSTVPHDTNNHKQFKSCIMALLLYVLLYSSTSPDYTKRINKSVDNIVCMLINNFDILFYYNPDGIKESTVKKNYDVIIDYINDHYTEKIVMSDIAKEIGLTPSYISFFLKKYTIGFSDLIGFIRLCKAQVLLLTTNLSVVEISERCGFSDTKYFYKCYRRWHNCTPTEFKQKYLSEKDGVEKYSFLEIKDVEKDIFRVINNHMIEIFL